MAKARSVVRPFSKVQEPEENESVLSDAAPLPIHQEDDLGEVIKRDELLDKVEVKKSKQPQLVDNEIDVDEDDIGVHTKQVKKKKRKTTPMEEPTSTSIVSATTKSAEKLKKKKKRKQGDAFDDLFSSLL